MSPKAIQELAEALRSRYRSASRLEKTKILDEFCATTGYHRKSAIRLLCRRSRPSSGKPRGRPPIYVGGEFTSALLLIRKASGYICGKYLPSAMPALIAQLERHEGLALGSDVRSKLLAMSGATADRLLQPHRRTRLPRRSISRRVVSDVRKKIERHTFAQLRELPLGHVEVDLVLHSGMTSKGFCLTTLTAVEINSSWTICIPVWGKGKTRVGGAVARLQRQAPYTLLGVHSDNGTEFINNTLYQFCQRNQLAFTSGRTHHPNDQPRVEQRNGSVPRRLIGYARYATREAMEQMDEVYLQACLHANFFKPTAKLVRVDRHGAKTAKFYDTPMTPYQRLLASGQLSDVQCHVLQEQFSQLNPLQLQRDLETALDALWLMESVDPASERMDQLTRAAKEASTR